MEEQLEEKDENVDEEINRLLQEAEEENVEEAVEAEGEAVEAEEEAVEAEEEAVEAEEIVEPCEEEEEEDEELEDVQEHLRDSVEGSLRLKRMLNQDLEDDENEDAGAKKRRRLDGPSPEIEAKVTQLLLSWKSGQDLIMRYVLEQLPMEELDNIVASKWKPDHFSGRKTPSDQLARFTAELRERPMVKQMGNDVINTFTHKWKLTAVQGKQLRGLNHKDMRYVVDNYEGEEGPQNLEDLISEAAGEMPDENSSACAPNAPGVPAMGRFSRLELIDPLADCAVFGDANLTFSMRLAKHRKSLGHVGRVIATTFEELDTLRERYKEIDQSIKMLEEHHAEVYHGVDCTRIAVDPRFKGMEDSLGAVYYNFPHSGAIQGFFDGHPIVNWRHENLMRLFFRALRSFVKPNGFVKVASNGNAVGVRFSYIIGGAEENEFEHIETMPFLEWHLHRYGRSYGDRRDVYKRLAANSNESYNAQAATKDMVYCFRYRPSGEQIGKQGVRLPPSFNVLKNCNEGAFQGVSAVARAKLARDLHKRFTTEISGTHVG